MTRKGEDELVFSEEELAELDENRRNRSSVTDPGRPRRRSSRRSTLRVPADVAPPKDGEPRERRKTLPMVSSAQAKDVVAQPTASAKTQPPRPPEDALRRPSEDSLTDIATAPTAPPIPRDADLPPRVGNGRAAPADLDGDTVPDLGPQLAKEAAAVQQQLDEFAQADTLPPQTPPVDDALPDRSPELSGMDASDVGESHSGESHSGASKQHSSVAAAESAEEAAVSHDDVPTPTEVTAVQESSTSVATPASPAEPGKRRPRVTPMPPAQSNRVAVLLSALGAKAAPPRSRTAARATTTAAAEAAEQKWLDTNSVELDVDALEEVSQPPPVPPTAEEPFTLAEVPASEVVVIRGSGDGDSNVVTSAPPDPQDDQPAAEVVTSAASASAAPKPAAATATAVRAEQQPALPDGWFSKLFDANFPRTEPHVTAALTQKEVTFIERSLQPAAESRVLDLACGYGRHAVELAAKGLQITAYDTSLPLLQQARGLAKQRGVQIDFRHADLRTIDCEETFDAAYCMETSFGYFDDDTNRRLIVAINRALKSGGRFLLDVVNRDYVIAELPKRMWWQGDGCVVLEEVEFNYFTSRVVSKRSVVAEDGRYSEYELSIRVYSLHELGKILHHAGFRVLEVSGDINHRTTFFGNCSRSLVLLAEKRLR